MKFKNISKKLESEDVYNVLIKNYSKLNADWVYHQWNWLHQNYSAFNDLIKYLITIALVRDTLKFYFLMMKTFFACNYLIMKI